MHLPERTEGMHSERDARRRNGQNEPRHAGR
jgi:hypothetical protein